MSLALRSPRYAEPTPVQPLPLRPADPHELARDAADIPMPDELVPWPWDAVDRIAGPLAAGSFTILSARTGSGKTLFVRNWIHWLATHSGADGPGIAYFPTETPTREVLRGIVCADLGVSPVDVSRGDFSRVEGGRRGFFDIAQRTAKALVAPRSTLRGPALMLFDHSYPTLAMVRESLKRAKDEGCGVAVVDHILRLDLGDAQMYDRVSAAARGLKMLAHEIGIAVVATSQQGRSAFQGDRLAAFAPPDLSALKGAGTLEEEADLVIFLHRLLRDDLGKEQIADVRAGRIPLQEAVMPNQMGVAIGKHRLDGSKTGAAERLWVEHGRVSDLPDHERRAWQARREGIHTGSRA